jgi:hypothetical protein
MKAQARLSTLCETEGRRSNKIMNHNERRKKKQEKNNASMLSASPKVFLIKGQKKGGLDFHFFFTFCGGAGLST